MRSRGWGTLNGAVGADEVDSESAAQVFLSLPGEGVGFRVQPGKSRVWGLGSSIQRLRLSSFGTDGLGFMGWGLGCKFWSWSQA